MPTTNVSANYVVKRADGPTISNMTMTYNGSTGYQNFNADQIPFGQGQGSGSPTSSGTRDPPPPFNMVSL